MRRWASVLWLKALEFIYCTVISYERKQKYVSNLVKYPRDCTSFKAAQDEI